jgi:hypothetical protein
VRPHPGGPASRLPSCGRFLAGPKPPLQWCFGLDVCVGGLSPSSLLCAFLKMCFLLCAFFVIFYIFTCFWVCVLQNMFLQKQVEQGQSICICVKVHLFVLFWTTIGGSKYAIVTANSACIITPPPGMTAQKPSNHLCKASVDGTRPKAALFTSKKAS